MMWITNRVQNIPTTTTKSIRYKGKKPKKRTTRTYRNKIKRITTMYNRLMKISKKSKEFYLKQSEEYKQKYSRDFFCDVYPTLESFMKNYKLKEPTL